ncbi:MAG: hypothetical protein ACJ762_20200 [Solirubrobacteraceae bacterium]
MTIRIEGKSNKTLVKERKVTLADAPITNKNDADPSHSCNGQSALGALHAGTGGDWGGSFSEGLGFFVDTIKGQKASGNDFYELWVNHKASSVGFCDAKLGAGDDVLVFRQACVYDPDTQQCPPEVTPLGVRVAKTIKRGTVRTVKIVDYAPSGKATAEAGATVFVNGAKLGKTNKLGQIKVKGTKTGTATIYATKSGHVRSETDSVRIVK